MATTVVGTVIDQLLVGLLVCLIIKSCITVRHGAVLSQTWLLMVAVPLTVFALDYCIRYPADSMTDVAAKQLEIVSVDFSDS